MFIFQISSAGDKGKEMRTLSKRGSYIMTHAVSDWQCQQERVQSYKTIREDAEKYTEIISAANNEKKIPLQK